MNFIGCYIIQKVKPKGVNAANVKSVDAEVKLAAVDVNHADTEVNRADTEVNHAAAEVNRADTEVNTGVHVEVNPSVASGVKPASTVLVIHCFLLFFIVLCGLKRVAIGLHCMNIVV